MTADPGTTKQSPAIEKALSVTKAEECLASELIDAVADGNRLDQDRIKRIFQGKFGDKFSSNSFRMEVQEARDRKDRERIHEAGEDEMGELLFYTLTEDGNASRMLHLYGDQMRYCPEFKSWLIWDGRRWKQDKSGLAQEMAVTAMREFLKQSATREGAAVFARKSLNFKAILACLSLAAPRVAVRAEELDKSPWLMNFRNGTVDLRTGVLRRHAPDDLITKLADHNYNLAAKCPQWHRFIDWTMGGEGDNPEGKQQAMERASRFTEYLQRSLGYSITGSTSEKALFIPWGERGNNGKTTMLVVIGRIIPEYSGMLDVETLMTRTRASTNASADIADLRGVRFVRTSEAEATQELSQGLVKKLTEGQGDVKAIKKYENWATFTATHKIWMDTNGRPKIRDTDDNAMMNRMHLIPFPASLSDEEIDRELPNRLVTDEASGILTWLVQGAMKWHKDGLERPDEAVAARDSWRDQMEQDDPWKFAIGNWIITKEKEYYASFDYIEQGKPFEFTVEQIMSGALSIKTEHQDDRGGNHSARVGRVLGKITDINDKPLFERQRKPRPERTWFYVRSKTVAKPEGP